MLRGLVYTAIVFIFLWLTVEFIHYISRPHKTIYDEPEFKLYYWQTLKALVKEVEAEEKEACWYCQHVVIDMHGDDGCYCKKKGGAYIPPRDRCNCRDFSAQIVSEGGPDDNAN